MDTEELDIVTIGYLLNEFVKCSQENKNKEVTNIEKYLYKILAPVHVFYYMGKCGRRGAVKNGIKQIVRNYKNMNNIYPDKFQKNTKGNILENIILATQMNKNLINKIEEYNNKYNKQKAFEDKFNKENRKLKEYILNKNPEDTKVEINRRMGQDLLRKSLIDVYQMCMVTGTKMTEFLVASHIKEWSKCDSYHEKLDLNNALLLQSSLDTAFNAHLISFSDNGNIIISKLLTEEEQIKNNIHKDMKLIFKLTYGHKKYLQYHRDRLKKNSKKD